MFRRGRPVPVGFNPFLFQGIIRIFGIGSWQRVEFMRHRVHGWMTTNGGNAVTLIWIWPSNQRRMIRTSTECIWGIESKGCTNHNIRWLLAVSLTKILMNRSHLKYAEQNRLSEKWKTNIKYMYSYKSLETLHWILSCVIYFQIWFKQHLWFIKCCIIQHIAKYCSILVQQAISMNSFSGYFNKQTK